MQNEVERLPSQPSDQETIVQPSLFGPATVMIEAPEPGQIPYPPLIKIEPLTADSSIASCAIPYEQELRLRDKSKYTVRCFLSDLKMFGDFVGQSTPVGRITNALVTDWLMNLKFGTPDLKPAPKTMARRITFLKNFFSWLYNAGVIHEDPTASITLQRPLPPLPELLFADEVQRLLDAAAADARCHCLVYLVLHAGLKKEELLGLKVQHIDLSNPQAPTIIVRYPLSTGKQHRERLLALPSEFTAILQKYQRDYLITESVFPYVERNLNYILVKAVQAADIKKKVTLQLLRDTYAVRQLQAGVPLDALREMLGLSDDAWLESKEKYRRLAFPAPINTTGEEPEEQPVSPSRLQELRSMPYTDYLQSPEWKAKRQKALHIADRRCQLCYSAEALDVHHRTYERRGQELLSDLVTLCKDCHQRFHQFQSLSRDY